MPINIDEIDLPPETHQEARSGNVVTLQEDGFYELIIKNALARMPNVARGNHDKIKTEIRMPELVEAAGAVLDIFFQNEVVGDPEHRVDANGQKNMEGFQPFPVIKPKCAISQRMSETFNKLSKLVVELRIRSGEANEVRFSQVLKEEFDKALTDPDQYLAESQGRSF